MWVKKVLNQGKVFIHFRVNKWINRLSDPGDFIIHLQLSKFYYTGQKVSPQFSKMQLAKYQNTHPRYCCFLQIYGVQSSLLQQ